MNIGYARVSTHEQNLDLQMDALRLAGCEQIFEDHGVSGTRKVRPGLTDALDLLRPDDALVVWRLDRLGRSLKNLIELIGDLEQRKIHFRSLHENIDTGSSGGRFYFHIMGALAEFERDLLSDRIKAGLIAARSRGRVGGRKPAMTPEQIAEAKAYYGQGIPIEEIAQAYHVTARTAEKWVVSR